MSNSLCILKKHSRNHTRLPLLVVPRRKKKTSEITFFPTETSWFGSSIAADESSALPYLVDDEASLNPRRLWCLFIRKSVPRYTCACCCVEPGFPRQCPLPFACHYIPKGTKLELGRGVPDEHSPQPTKPPSRLYRPGESRSQPISCISSG